MNVPSFLNFFLLYISVFLINSEHVSIRNFFNMQKMMSTKRKFTNGKLQEPIFGPVLLTFFSEFDEIIFQRPLLPVG